MAAQAVDKTVVASGAQKKKGKTDSIAEAPVNGIPALPIHAKEDSNAADADGSSEHPYVRELHKQIRNINKKIGSSQKLDVILAENQGVSLDDLVAQRKINADQKAAALKKPQLLAQLAQLEDQVEHYRKFEAEFTQKLAKQKSELSAEHQKELQAIKEEVRLEAVAASATELRQKLLVFSQFLRAAAAKRMVEEESNTDESLAFEGTLLLVYGGDEKAVDTAVNLIDGSSDQVPNIEGVLLPVTYSQVKQASLSHAPFEAQETWVDQVAEATAAGSFPTSDPTLANAGLTELSSSAAAPTADAPSADPSAVNPDDTAGNVAGETWSADTKGGANSLEDSYEIVPRPANEVDQIPGSASGPPHASSQAAQWSEQPPVYEAAVGNRAGESWDTKAAGDASGAVPAEPAGADGFHEVSGRPRGRGGYRGRGDGEYRGRGDGEFRGRGRGRGGNFRGRGGDGEFRGRGGFRGGRGDGEYRGRGDGEFRGRGRGRGGPRGGAGETPAAPPS